VNDRSPYGLPKKQSCDEAGSSTGKVEQSAYTINIQIKLYSVQYICTCYLVSIVKK